MSVENRKEHFKKLKQLRMQ